MGTINMKMSDENQEQVNAIRDAIKACEVGDVPDLPLGILSILRLNGWKLERQRK
jgi:hypothetical protein|tara:strand:- start:71 stop:235 length:165 start_codon:yes stop_codon:yes gene_type:complete